MWRPLAKPTPVQQAMETAIVVGPKEEEVHVDEHGRVKVQFHWDLEGKHDEHSSCWLRVTQPWAGANWGAQFLPRIGAEVLVGFVGGDVDRPIVMGSLYNGTRPTPFRLPAEINKAGFRSQSTPGGEGYSELTFDDLKGRERMVLRAERQLEQTVGQDLQIEVGGAERVTIAGKSERTIAGDAVTVVHGERKDELAKSYQVLVKGSHAVGVDGDAETRISGNRVTRIEGRDEIELAEAKATYLDSQINRVLGHLVTVVGQHDARKSATMHVEGSSSHSTTGTTEISSDKEIVLRVGDSSLRLSPDGIELVTKQVVLHGEQVQLEANDRFAVFAEKQIALNAEQVTTVGTKKVVVKGEEGQLTLDKNARLDGAEVKLNCSPDPVEEGAPPEYEPPKKTTISLSDEDGNPIPGRRYVIIASDGSERAGKLDESGVAELYLEQGGKIVFPDVDNPRKA
ncbi:MAG TPA: type VI secretion system tip protein VgrG, partial [Polyangiaceae bacterium]|nr:type VI secretion system tip protein VgrG [Polyangiaceae bacterium]